MGWPVRWLKEMIDESEFALWCKYFQHRPFDDQSNFHYPIANLTATVANLAGGSRKLTDFLIFRKQDPGGSDSEIDVLLRQNFAD